MPLPDFGGPRASPTPAEIRFLDALAEAVDFFFDVWLHEDSDGTPWMVVSLDFPGGTDIRRTLRLDFDGTTIKGGWSPANLNWDDGVRAEQAEVETAPPVGINVESESVDVLAQSASDWFRCHRNN